MSRLSRSSHVFFFHCELSSSSFMCLEGVLLMNPLSLFPGTYNINLTIFFHKLKRSYKFMYIPNNHYHWYFNNEDRQQGTYLMEWSRMYFSLLRYDFVKVFDNWKWSLMRGKQVSGDYYLVNILPLHFPYVNEHRKKKSISNFVYNTIFMRKTLPTQGKLALQLIVDASWGVANLRISLGIHP